ncbi:MAG: phosphoenolpyruvate--protein phosphotransferase, partial [Gaiellaceae bacterium]
AVRVAEAIERADSGDGVLVLMDLGSAVLSAETALDLLPPERRARVLLCEAPLVEGAVAAAVAARLGTSLEGVAAEARGGLQGKTAHLGAGEPAAPVPAGATAPLEEGLTLRLRVENPLGLHARPAARFVQTAAGFDANVEVINLTSGRGPASARSLNGLATLGVRQGHEILVSAHGLQAAAALEAIAELAGRDFDEKPAPVAAPALPVSAATAQAGPLPDAGALAGLPGAPGIARGAARHFRPAEPEIPTGSSGDPEAEWDALGRALERVRTEISSARESVASRAGEYSAAIFDAHLLFLDDEALLGPARRAIFEEGRNAAEAWDAAASTVAAEYRSLDDDYLQARADDLAGVARQVVAALVGGDAARPSVAAPGIVVAADLTPADTAALDRELVLGIATAAGSPTSHSAILARSLGIPAAVGLGDALLAVPEGTVLLLDGDAGVVYVDPAEELVADHERHGAAREEAARLARAAALEPALTRDGRQIEVVANIGSPEDVPAAIANGAEGVGLLRTEFLFLERDSLPSEDEQHAAYKSIAKQLEGRPLILRTLDVGGDKPLPYLPVQAETNPFLGVRGIRLALATPALLETQLRAALRTAAEYPLQVMFPMVATLDEYRQAKAVLARAREGLERAGASTPDALEVGVMIEVPAAALAAEVFAPEVDFFSIGTNDLVQYTMAAERGNPSVAGLADGLHPSVLRLIRIVCESAHGHGKWVGVCGELASDPLAVAVLVGLGVAELSANAPAIPAVKQAVRNVDAGAAGALAEEALGLSSAAEVCALLAGETAELTTVSSRSAIS